MRCSPGSSLRPVIWTLWPGPFCLERLTTDRGAPRFIRMDLGPELAATPLRHLCRFTGSSRQNLWSEPFNGKLRDEQSPRTPNGWAVAFNGEHRHLGVIGDAAPDGLADGPTQQ